MDYIPKDLTVKSIFKFKFIKNLPLYIIRFKKRRFYANKVTRNQPDFNVTI